MSAQLHHRPALRPNQDTFLDPHESQAPPKSNKNLAHGIKWLALISIIIYVLSSKAPQAPSPNSVQPGGVHPDQSQARPTIRELGQHFASQANTSLSSSFSDSQQVEVRITYYNQNGSRPIIRNPEKKKLLTRMGYRFTLTSTIIPVG
jgi:hypothetical protein